MSVVVEMDETDEDAPVSDLIVKSRATLRLPTTDMTTIGTNTESLSFVSAQQKLTIDGKSIPPSHDGESMKSATSKLRQPASGLTMSNATATVYSVVYRQVAHGSANLRRA